MFTTLFVQIHGNVNRCYNIKSSRQEGGGILMLHGLFHGVSGTAPEGMVAAHSAEPQVPVDCRVIYRFTERDGRKGPPAGNKARFNRTNTPHSKAMQRKAKPNQTPQTHTRAARQA
jgi:hypothetical protein